MERKGPASSLEKVMGKEETYIDWFINISESDSYDMI